MSLLRATALLAVDPNRLISQYAHAAWQVRDGSFRGSPDAIVQTKDGYIWIGTESGLLRFDGVRFSKWASPDGAQLRSPEVYSLVAAADGSLWIGTNAGLSHWANGRLFNYPGALGTITAIEQDHNGTIWFTRVAGLDRSGRLCQVVGTTTQCHGELDGLPDLGDAMAIVTDSLGTHWFGGDTALVRWRPGSTTVFRPNGLKNNSGVEGVTSLAVDADGSIWAGMALSGADMGLQHLVAGLWKPFIVPELDGRKLEIDCLFIDSHNALWVGTLNQGIYRIFQQRVSHYDTIDGLTGNLVSRFLEDREGNVWVTTSKGVDKFSDLQVATYSTREGLASEEVDSVLASRTGTLWIGEVDALDALRDGKVSSIRAGKGLPGNQVTSLFEDHKGRLWVGIDSGLTIYEKGAFRRIRGPGGEPFGIIVDMCEDTNGDLWLEIGEPSRKLVHIHDDKVRDVHLPSEIPASRKLAADPSGGLWLGTLKGDLVRYLNGHTEQIDFKHHPDSRVEQLQVDTDGSVLGATAFGLIGWRQGKTQTLTVLNGLPCNGILTMLFDNYRALWLDTQCGLVHITNAQLKEWWQHPEDVLHVQVFDEFSGIQSGWVAFQKSAKTADGRLWFAHVAVLQMIDPDHLYKNDLSPPVSIESVVVDRKIYAPSEHLHLPPLARELEIDYTALSFMVPQKVHFRYKLDGHDVDWQDAGTRRQAFYNDLGPGTFTFHVLACNNDGVWNETGASLQFTVTPTWYQTLWFRVLWITTACILILALYQIRVRAIARAISVRFDARLDERTRMALELHDTFLQTVQGSKMVADDALDAASDQLRMRHALERLSLWLGQAVTEGRAALHALRVSTTERNDLAEFLDRSAMEHSRGTSISVALTVIGDAVDLHPIVRDEVARIAEEGIRNACIHSNASQLGIELRYARDLSLCIKDDGVGIIPEIIDAGKAGHFGLRGMRDRSARIRARITITSTLNGGTQIILNVPGDVVYLREKKTFLRTLRELKLWRDSKAKGGDHAEAE